MNHPVDESLPDDTPEYPLSAPIKPDDPERKKGDREEEEGPAG
ncbi:hypothetical protein [Pseudomonas sp. dw_358]|nr:hypothetical protein [Pseudomonas sp. dw_358]